MYSRLTVIAVITFSIFSNYLLSPYYVPDTILVSRDRDMNRGGSVLPSWSLYSSVLALRNTTF